MSFYNRARATASGMIAKFGQAGTLRKITKGSGHNPTQTTADHACRLLVLGYSNEEIDGTRIQTGDKRVLVSHMAVAPTLSDRLVIGGESHAIIGIEPLSPAGIVVMWEVQARK